VEGWRYEGEILWYFSAGQSAFERSTFGAQLERLAAEGVASDGSRVPSGRDAAAKVWAFHVRRVSVTEPITLDVETAAELRALLPWDDWDPGETARPRPTQASEPVVMPSDVTLIRYARVSRTLSRLAASAGRALALWYGNRGGFWALRHLGRIMAVLPETRAGRRLLAGLPGAGDMRPDERIAAAFVRQQAWPDTGIGLLLRVAERQALRAMCDARAGYDRARGNGCTKSAAFTSP
jgi:hypothetical protein